MALFDYGNARLRARLSILMPLEKLEAFADLTSIDSLLSQLTYTPYKESIETALTFAHGYECLTRAMRMEFGCIVDDLNRFYEDGAAHLVSLIFMRDDLLNLKSVIRGLMHEVPLDELADSFLSLGSIPIAYLNEIARAKSLNDAVDKMVIFQIPAAQALLKLRLSTETLNSSEINLALEKWYFEKINEELKGNSENDTLLHEFYAIEADIINLNTILRLLNSSNTQKDYDIERYFIEQGNISKKQLLKLSQSNSVEQVIQPLFHMKYRHYLKRGLENFLMTGLLSEFENQLRLYMLGWMARLPHLYPLGVGVPLGYYGRKRNEIRNLRWIGKGIASGFEPVYIKENIMRIQ